MINEMNDMQPSHQTSEPDPDDTSIEEIKANLLRALHQAKMGQRIPLAQMWKGIDTEEAI